MTSTKYTNRLIHETSPYLLQHAHNPVDWWPWCDQAFEQAKMEDKPVLLSCGYSACHWCHVMERESFEDPGIAELMNRYYICIKVDREERPDIDQTYQHAVQLISGQGGWPLTVFLDHNRRPFFGGTYFPPAPMYGRLSFPELLQAIHQKWTGERERILEAGNELAKYLNSGVEDMKAGTSAGKLPEAEFPVKAARELSRLFDPKYGGFGRAPKFPNPTLLLFLLRIGTVHREPEMTDQVIFTLEQMARGGIYDQLGGGFHRYATDECWLVPHFEKMLYDNAQLLRIYTIGYQITKSEHFKNIVQETTNYIRREMTAPEGGFYATQDADSEGEEGKYYLWNKGEIRQLLTAEDAQLIIEHFHISEKGNFEGKNILHRLRESNFKYGDFKPENEVDKDLLKKLNRIKSVLLQYREKRVKPFRDEKIITSWNGLMIGAFAYAYQVFQNPLDYRSAKKAVEFILNDMRLPEGALLRIYKDGQAKINAFLDDYAFLAQSLIDLYETDFNQTWLEQSIELSMSAVRLFSNGNGRYYLTRKGEGELINRPLSGYDQAIPSGVSVHCENLMRLAAFTGKKELTREIERIFLAYQDELHENIWGYTGFIGTLDIFNQQLKEFVFVSESPDVPEILIKLRRHFLPYHIVAWENISRNDLSAHPARYLFEGRKTLNSKPTCYPCHNYQCSPPVTEWEDLLTILNSKRTQS